jgi:hypothetical protein
MSTIAHSETYIERAGALSRAEDSFAPYQPAPAMTGGQDVGVRYAEVRSKERPTHQKTKPLVLRRFQGFLIESQGLTARVGFIQNGEVIQYDMPAEQLRRSGIEIKNQPFQMDEIEMPSEGGGIIVGYRFRPLAKAADAYVETLDLDEERKRKRNLILQEFAKAKG